MSKRTGNKKNFVKKSARRFSRTLKAGLKSPKTYIFLVIIILVIFSTIAVFESETQTDSGIESKFDSIWFTFVALFAGYFDYVVKSYTGRLGAAILLILGIILISTITGKISSMFMDTLMKKDK